MIELFRIFKGREFQMMGAATEKLRDPKPVRTRGTKNKLETAAQGIAQCKVSASRVVVDAALRRIG